MPTIEVNNLTLTYLGKKNEEYVALDNFSATFENEKFNVILGYSGCGKTTLLKLIAGIYDYDGTIKFDGMDMDGVATSKRKLSYVTQQYSLYPHLTVYDNIAFPLKVLGADRDEINTRVMEMAKELDLVPCLTRKPKHISGGQQQRVALARELIKRPQVCLLDEPLSNIDERMRGKARVQMKKALTASGCTVIYVTHNIPEAMALADKIFVMNNGKLEISGTPQEVYNSDNAVVKSLRQAEEDDVL